MQDPDLPVLKESLNRRQFVTAMAAAAIGTGVTMPAYAQSAEQREVFIVPNFHPASCGWLTNFSRERVYCANSYLNQLDRVREDPNYKFLFSEANNFIAIMNFKPERVRELIQRVKEGRVELVDGYFLEMTFNLSGGEALVRQGVEGLRWYEKVVGIKPRFGWNIDTCGTHEQMAQISSGLGFEAMVYTRKNPTGKTIFWTVSPDGSKTLTLCPGAYAEASSIFKTTKPLDHSQLQHLETLFDKKDAITPTGAPILILAGSGDYSLAPALKSYPTLLLKQWKDAGMKHPIRFATLSDYLDPILPRLQSGDISIPTFKGETEYTFDAFWIENYEVKRRYRHGEQSLQAAEMLSSLAHLTARHDYPVQDLHDSWILMCLNMDRNTLWGSAGGMVFASVVSWDVQDRFNWVDHAAEKALKSAATAMLSTGNDVGLFNQLNWRRNDPVALNLPPGTTIAGADSELLPDNRVLCRVDIPSMSVGGWKLEHSAAESPSLIDLAGSIETAHYSLRIDRHTGAITSIKFKKTGRELLAGPANVVVAERPKKKEASPADFMPPRPERAQLATSSDQASTIQLFRGPVAYTIQIDSPFYGGGGLRRIVRLYHDHPRIDFETVLNDIPNYTVVLAEFPLAIDVTDVRRGIPYGFSHGSWGQPNSSLHGWTKGIVPAVRWIDYGFADGGGVAIFDRGATGREIDGNTPVIYLLNAEDEYHGYPNPWLSGEGRHAISYSLYPHESPWAQARVPQMAWEYNCPPIVTGRGATQEPRSIVHTSDNVIIEALRCEQNHIELRMVECLGKHGTADIKLMLPHKRAALTDLAGRKQSELPNSGDYRIPVRPQQIVTIQFETSSSLQEAEPVTKWDKFVPRHKLPVLHEYNPKFVGHPPFGNASNTF